MVKSLPTPQPLEMQGDMTTNWEIFNDSWEDYIIATEVNKKSDAIVVATFLTVMGKDCYRIYKNLPLTDDERKSPTPISNDSLYIIQSNQKKRQYFAQVLAVTGDKTARQSIKFQLDTGATCSTLSLNDYNKLTKKQPEQSQTELRTYNQSTIKPMGQVKLHCTANGITRKVHFQIIKEAPTSLLSGRVCEAFKLLEFNEECVHQIEPGPKEPLTNLHVLHDYKDVFSGL
ncbi:predicted protein [Nematostella vectensis]|uniref:Peptidase A2 domain-containing protein n=1 Tax=Nematostella vectensis TaxID=45351 RepID=A7S1Q3_NEMVE|nr:predicted protein [Nematostella vectensis]|eukprot:XP_001634471.1 predicted protein [Nematostella vectensis]